MQRKSRKEREYQARRSDILDAAERLFASKGFHNTTMAEIAQESEFAIGTLYQFFKNKEDLYYTMVIEKLGLLYSSIGNNVSRFRDSLKKVEGLIKTQLSFFQDNRDFFAIFIKERGSLEATVNEDFGEVLRQRYLSYIDLVADVMLKGIRQSKLKDLDAREMAWALLGIINSFVFQWIINPQKGTLVSKSVIIMDLFLRGAGEVIKEEV
ncbi:MAG: TetR/AcrR family transcriptional regulator [Desulfobacterales bacterium]|nr:TetR/AcrR family transcriptional regulator [Desulfobacterales bacterium]